MLDEIIVKKIREYFERLDKQGKLPAIAQLNEYYATFRDKFGPDSLRDLDGEELLEVLHSHQNHNSLVYWLEFKNDTEFPRIFGSIAGGSAHKFSLYKSKDSGEWIAGSAPKNRVVTNREAINIAQKHRDQLLRGCELLEKVPSDGSEADYKALQERMDEFAPDVSDTAWGHKYFSLLYPAKLDDYHNADYQRYHLIKLLEILPPEQGRYIFAGRFVAIAKQLSLPLNHLTTILNEMDGPPHSYWRIGTKPGDDGGSEWDSMRDNNSIFIGWKNLGDLSELQHDQQSKDRLKELIKERYYPNSAQLAGKKGTEVFRFVTIMAEGDIVVASEGSVELGIGRIIGDYTYDQELEFVHRRAVEWLSLDESKQQVRECWQTTVCELKKPENLVEIERRILGLPPLEPRELSVDSLKELILAYSKAARKVSDGTLRFRYLDFQSSERKIDELKRLFRKFLAEPPTSENLAAFWNRTYLELSDGGGSAGHLLARGEDGIEKVQEVLSELDRSEVYQRDWEHALRSHGPLWELWGKIKGGPLPSFAWTGLSFFGCKHPVPSYPAGFLHNYERFLQLYQDTLGKTHVTRYRSEIEINQLFSLIWTIKNKRIGPAVQALGDPDVLQVYDLIQRIQEEGWRAPASALPELTGTLRRIERALEGKSQVILHGPPGTGKTYWAKKAALTLVARSTSRVNFEDFSEDEKAVIQEGGLEFGKLVRMCTFHPSYGYEEFIEGYRPRAPKGPLIFPLEDGIFRELCKDADSHPNNDFYLIIDEINRGDIPRIFGELLTILEKDKRGQEIVLPFSKDPFSVPTNVRLIATMNTADRSIALLDTALRRRFAFVELMPDSSQLRNTTIEGIKLASWLEALNQEILKHMGPTARDLQIGHSYLSQGEGPITDFESFARAIQDDIIPLLQEYCYESFSTLQKILGDELIDAKHQKINEQLFEPSQKERLIQALSRIASGKSTVAATDELQETESTTEFDEDEELE
jgi:MoxR-like ATPase